MTLGYSLYHPYILKLKRGFGTCPKGSIVDAGRVTYEDGTFDYIMEGNYLIPPKDCEVLN